MAHLKAVRGLSRNVNSGTKTQYKARKGDFSKSLINNDLRTECDFQGLLPDSPPNAKAAVPQGTAAFSISAIHQRPFWSR
ncbi:hypothetical protein ACFSHT_06045 [Paraburkholderia silviterrae]|uniref:Uncharacterized protein n=1 Tax=Paraburkholderia silviterrae TaxID=2528715 RepID=A0A4R5MC37_9BURK|nr:hypothetical protein [Paraburkholderia silviterrae]TDG24468.1 hypothetical protein EYW47_07840 [Paraburkholderia silviterrae]